MIYFIKENCASIPIRETMDKYVDKYGIIQEVCGCPHFVSVGTSAESMAAYILMNSYYGRLSE